MINKRFCITATGVIFICAALLILLNYGYHNWRVDKDKIRALYIFVSITAVAAFPFSVLSYLSTITFRFLIKNQYYRNYYFTAITRNDLQTFLIWKEDKVSFIKGFGNDRT